MSGFENSGSGPPNVISSQQGQADASSLRLGEAIQLANDTTMQDILETSTEIDRQLNIDTSEDEYEDSISDSSSTGRHGTAPRGLSISTLPTGLCYDERMRYHSEVSAPTGDSVHPEDPRRIYYIFKELHEAGLVALGDEKPLIDPPLKRINAREATRQEICTVHTQDHFDFVKSTQDMTDEQLIDLSESPLMDSIYFNRLSYYSGLLSAGGTIETCRSVVQREVKNAIAVVRPPGHHAETECTMGFCLFNNTCIASRVCQQDFGEKCRKIFILDWDVHHGNGCQKAFYDDPNILYISLHVHMDGHFYPSGPDGDMYHCGEGPGLGKNINIPWKSKGMGDGDYMFAFQHVVMPVATEFDPDLVIVSAGFDAAAGDELGGCFVSPACYAHMTHMLMSLANGKVAVCLEGGYNFTAISRSALAVTRTLMGEPPDRLEATQATQSAVQVVQDVRQIQSKYWKSIYPKDLAYGIDGGERLHDIIREWQAMHLYDKYRLNEVHVFRDNISRSFNKQVLASPMYESKKDLIVFFHDPPDLMSPQNLMTTRQKPHETWLSYIHAAISNDFGVLDINVPEHITMTSDPPTSALNPPVQHHRYANTTVSFAQEHNDLARRESEKLVSYIWENYVDPYDFRLVFLIGAGNAYHGVAKLISDNQAVYKRLSGVFAFISENPVRVISNTNGPFIANWYRANSQIYVSSDHALWTKDKVSKRYGALVRGPPQIRGLNALMSHYHTEVWEHIMMRVKEVEQEEEAEKEDEDGNDEDNDDVDEEDEESNKDDEDGGNPKQNQEEDEDGEENNYGDDEDEGDSHAQQPDPASVPPQQVRQRQHDPVGSDPIHDGAREGAPTVPTHNPTSVAAGTAHVQAGNGPPTAIPGLSAGGAGTGNAARNEDIHMG